MGLSDDCEELFGTKELFKILDIDETSEQKKIKKAYYKQSLKFHPDKSTVAELQINTRKFQALSKIHEILSDAEKLKLYRETGEIDDEMDTFDENSDWVAYWRDRFPKITVKMIDEFKQKYQNSAEERVDLLDSYKKHKGKMDAILDEIPCCNAIDDESRFREIIEEAISAKEVRPYKAFTNEKAASKKNRAEAAALEAEEAEQYGRELGIGSGASTDDLANMILQRRRVGQEDLISRLEAKYAQPKKKRAKKT